LATTKETRSTRAAKKTGRWTGRPPAFVALNNDDGDSPPVPDLQEAPVQNEDNLSRLDIAVTPMPSAGTLQLETPAGAGRIRFWDSATDNPALSTITAKPGFQAWGCFTAGGDIPHQKRLEIMGAAASLVTREDEDKNDDVIAYCLVNALEPAAWNNILDSITALRCDGLVEVCYECSGVPVWGKIVSGSTHYDIRDDSYQEEHDVFNLSCSWIDTLQPATQCGHESTHKGTIWDTTFSAQNLCSPAGSKGGNQ